MADDKNLGERGGSEPTAEITEVEVDWLPSSGLHPDAQSSQTTSEASRLNTTSDSDLPQVDTVGATPSEPSKPGLFTPLRRKPKADSFWSYGPKWIALLTVIIGVGFWNSYRSDATTDIAEEAPSQDPPSETAEAAGETTEAAGATAEAAGATTEAAGETTHAMAESTRFNGPTATLNIRSVPSGANVLLSDGDGSNYGRCQTPCVADVPFHEDAGATNRIVLEFQIEGYQMLRLERHLFGVEPLSFVALPTPAKADR